MATSDEARATTPAEDHAMLRALELAARGPVRGPNPRVGCVLLTTDGRTIGEGWHRGAGTAHAEVAALEDARAAGHDVRGATAVVTLEPCDHTGRTGPCTRALLAAGVARVVHAVDDPDPAAGGGARTLRSAGVDVVGGVRRAEGEALLETWLHAVRDGRPWVTLKTATSLDGRVAAADGTSRWITSTDARADAHRTRAVVDAVVVGTGTVLADDPALTVRHGADGAHRTADEGGAEQHRAEQHRAEQHRAEQHRAEQDTEQHRAEQDAVAPAPLRVVVGHRAVPDGARLRGPGGELVHLRTHDVDAVLAELAARGARHVLVEGGPTLASAFLRAGRVDELHAYVAPVLLGAGPTAVGDLGVTTLADAPRWSVRTTRRVGTDVLVVARPVRQAGPAPDAPASLSPGAAAPPGVPVPPEPASEA
ncbi:bifunctional diaminohydroxyphosphoribosylaminopyrimidine deaminase/5-amino-6-(5-phosphoribosylamino)uracil reductase RibD [Actinotalea sp. AC32]|nr:bifunctional diaminohydroxyphosphoribosylaminopyrimidine deaminase/5-amino-6-(5-phosphoribosylamino)uracil reductase RibD [Actinotalea sp. AC32]